MNKTPKITDHRDYFKPFAFPWAYEAWLKHEQSHWLFNEIPMIEDVKDWNRRLSKEEQYFLTQIFRFFTQSDIDVASGYIRDYLPVFSHPEIRMMLLGFAAREAVHIAAYSHLIETLGMPETTYNEFYEYEAMRKKHEFFHNEINKDTILPVKIAAVSAFTEGLALFSSFAMLLNFPRHGKMRGMGQIIGWSIVDEEQHCEGMIKIFRTYVEENRKIWNDKTKKAIYDIAEKMVDLENQFIDLTFKMGHPEGLREEEIKEYVKYIADRRLISMGMKGIFKVKKNPLPWVSEMINAPGHTNFFEQKSNDYSRATMTGDWGDIWAQ